MWCESLRDSTSGLVRRAAAGSESGVRGGKADPPVRGLGAAGCSDVCVVWAQPSLWTLRLCAPTPRTRASTLCPCVRAWRAYRSPQVSRAPAAPSQLVPVLSIPFSQWNTSVSEYLRATLADACTLAFCSEGFVLQFINARLLLGAVGPCFRKFCVPCVAVQMFI